MSSSRPDAAAAIVFGILALAAIPAAAAAAWFLPSVQVLPAILVSVPAAFFFALCGISASRRARFRLERSVYRVGERATRVSRTLVFLGLYASVVGGLALGFYGLLRAAS